MNDELLTGKQAADYLGVHYQTIHNWKRDGKIKPTIVRINFTLYKKSYLDKVKREMEKRKGKK